MEQNSAQETQVNRKTQWMIFFISTILFFVMLAYLPSFFWVVLPFMLTSFVYAMDWV